MHCKLEKFPLMLWLWHPHSLRHEKGVLYCGFVGPDRLTLGKD